MTLRILLLYSIFTVGLIKAQKLSTVFIDTLKITVDNKTIYENNKTVLKFIPNNIDNTLTVYEDGKYRLNINFTLNRNEYSNSLSASGASFFVNDSISALSNMGEISYEECTETLIEKLKLQNWRKDEQIPESKTQILLKYRYTIIAPIDTSNYKYNHKEGIWIGPYFDAQVILNYKNDKKNGLAKTLYDNGDSYNVYFNNDIAENYGQGKFQYPANGKFKRSHVIPYIITLSCDTANISRQETFYLSRGKKTKEINKYKDLSVHFQKKGISHDSIQFRVRGEFLIITKDTLVIKSNEIEIHDFYKPKTDSLHDFYKKTQSDLVKVPIKDIFKIYYTRDKWQTFTQRTALISLASAIIVAPLVSIEKGKFNTDRFSKVSLTSLGVMTLSISLGIGFSQKEYLLIPNKKKNKNWKIKYDAYK